MPSNVTILGSTGSIGASALRVIDAFPSEFHVFGLSCNANIATLRSQIVRYKPSVVAIAAAEVVGSEAYVSLIRDFPNIQFLECEEGVIQLAQMEVDILLSAIVGAAGFKPAIAAIPHIKRLALANKETLVMGGELVQEEVQKYATELIPVDSEHSAILSLLQHLNQTYIEKIILTASGGSLLYTSLDDLAYVSPEHALNHPTWSMGDKITIDSATLMNKGLEVIEAHHLFDIAYDKIDVIIHPESIIHSMVETTDGAIYAHMGKADMAFPILQAFVYPEKRENPFGNLDLAAVGTLTFKEYDVMRFPALQMCYDAGKEGGTMPVVLNSANEVAVKAFLDKKIRYIDIVQIVQETLGSHKKGSGLELEAIFRADSWAREYAKKIIRGKQ
jgi:1-deoxy-D-xylulose-5-phosphate reductoisomerase